MRILYITSDLPFPPDSGSRIRSLHFLNYLAGKGRVTLLSPVSAAGRRQAREANRFCERIVLIPDDSFGSPGWRDRFSSLARLEPWEIQEFHSEPLCGELSALSPEGFDLIVVRYLNMAYYLFRQKRWQSALDRTVLDLDDVSIRMYERTLGRMPPGYRRLRTAADLWFLKNYYRQIKRVGACLTASRLDRDILTSSGLAERAFADPNVFESNGPPAQLTSESGRAAFLFCGKLSYGPNQEGALFFAEEVFPRIRAGSSQARFLIIGKNPSRRILDLARMPGIRVVGPVDSTRPYYEEAAAAVVPLMNGGGTRVKILEAMAYGRPVVSTSVGCEGLDVENGKNILIADRPEDFADGCLQLLRDPALAERIAEEGRRFVRENHDAAAFGRAMDACLAALPMKVRENVLAVA